MSASSIPHAARTQAVGDQYKALDICVVTFNSARVVKSLIESVAGDPIVARVRVFDNASQDDSHEVARATAAELDVPVELIRSARNIGFAAASNELLRRCEAGTVALVNPDVQLRPGVTSRLVATVTTELSVGLATCRLMTAGD
jgi:GT2 family glycosyltransferase